MNVVISQALATGLPVISTRHSGIPEQITNGVNGFLVEEGDVHALAEKIGDYCDHPDLWPAMSKRGRDHIQKNFNLPDLIKEQIALYQNLLDS